MAAPFLFEREHNHQWVFRIYWIHFKTNFVFVVSVYFSVDILVDLHSMTPIMTIS